MKKFLSMLLCVAMVLSFVPTAFAAGETATLVADASDLKAGDKIVILSHDSTAVMGSQNSGGYRNKLAATVSSDKKSLTVTDDMAVLTIEAGTSTGTFALKASDGYLSFTGSKNKVFTVANKTATESWAISISNNLATITNASATTRVLQYNANSGQERFACYTGTQKSVTIYKLSAGQTNPDQVVAAAVIGKINAIGTPVTTASKTAIEAARAAYTALTDTQKALVTNLATLTAAETKLAELLSAAKPFANGDKVIIYAPAYKKALSTTKTGNYNVGVDITINNGVVTGYADTEVFTVVFNEDGTYSFVNGDKKLGMADQYTSMNMGDVNDKWELTNLGNNLYLLKNAIRGTYMEWYAQYSNWSTYGANNAATDNQFQLSFYVVPTMTPDQEAAMAVDNLIGKIGFVTKLSKEDIQAARTAFDALSDTQKPLVTKLETLTAAEKVLEELEKEPAGLPFANGDQVVIYVPAYKKAFSSNPVSEGSYYQAGVDVTLTDGKLSGYGETEIWTVVIHEDGKVSFKQGDKNIGMGADYGSMSMGAENDKWEIISLGKGLYLIKNVVRGNYMEWYASKGNWSTHNPANPAAEDLFRLSFYVVPKVNPDEEAAKAVDALIDAIGEVTLEKEDAITAARKAHDELSDAAKALVTKLATLTAAETKLAQLKKETEDKAAADAVMEKINAIGEVALEDKEAIEAARAAYTALTEDQKKLVTNEATLVAAEAQLKVLQDQAAQNAADKAKADAVIALIEAIGEVTLESENDIKAARDAYDALTTTQKALVENSLKLTNAEARLQELKDAAAQAAADKKAADAVITMIDAIGEVTKESKDAIEAARAAYDALTDAQKQLVTNYDALTKAEEAYKGIAATGDNTMLFVALVMLSMTGLVVLTSKKRAF